MKNLDLIDKYFSNTLSPQEQMVFNDYIQNNEEFKSEFLFQKDLKEEQNKKRWISKKEI